MTSFKRKTPLKGERMIHIICGCLYCVDCRITKQTIKKGACYARANHMKKFSLRGKETRKLYRKILSIQKMFSAIHNKVNYVSFKMIIKQNHFKTDDVFTEALMWRLYNHYISHRF